MGRGRRLGKRGQGAILREVQETNAQGEAGAVKPSEFSTANSVLWKFTNGDKLLHNTPPL